MTESVDLLIEQVRDVAAAAGDRTMFGRVYQALVAERQKVVAVQSLVRDSDGVWVDGDAYDGLAGKLRTLVGPNDLAASPLN